MSPNSTEGPISEIGVFRKRKLPHWDVEGHPVFITGSLHGSIPAAGLQGIREYRAELESKKKPEHFTIQQWQDQMDQLVFEYTDQLLDHKSPVLHLRDARQARIVQDAFLHFSGDRYKLFAYIVMPSHHHWLFLPDADWSVEAVKLKPLRTPREIISHSIQSYTANKCNALRGTQGKYWQAETFDHWVRNDAEFIRIIDYIEGNPVVAGLVSKPEDYPWSSASYRAKRGISLGDSICP